MMATTHALWGMALAIPVAYYAPELAPVALVAGFAGGLVPDLDLYVGHRRTLHYPVYGWFAAIPAALVAVATPTPLTVTVAVGLLAATLHAVSDVGGAGLELRPWRAGTDRAVYSHYHRRWLPARRWVRYDGAPEDLALAGVAGMVVFATAPTAASQVSTTLVAAVLVVSGLYTALRKPLADVAGLVAGVLPAPLRPYVPARYHDA